MDNRYLLYIDVLGFRELSRTSPEKVDDLFEIVASLHAHSHDQFSTIVFSDTILVHNLPKPESAHDHHYAVMYQCEFFRDLLHRTAGRGFSFRAILTFGPFEHYRLNDSPFFYGDALIRAYDADKSLQLTGLVMDNESRRHSDIFSTHRISEDWNYTFVTQALDSWEDTYEAPMPLPGIIVKETDLGWMLGPELELLAYYSRQASQHPDSRVRNKFKATLRLYKRRYPRIFKALEPTGFAMESVSSEFDWSKVRERFQDSYSWGSKKAPARGGR